MLRRKEIFILTPATIEGARSTLAYCLEDRDDLRSYAEEYPLEIKFDKLGLMMMFQDAQDVDRFIKALRRSILYYESLSDSDRLLDPPLRKKQPDLSFDPFYFERPTTPTSTARPPGLHPYLGLLFGGSEPLDTSKPLFLRMDEKRRSMALKSLKELKRRPWYTKTFNDSLAYTLSGMGCKLHLKTAKDYRWFVEGVELSVRYPMAVRGNTDPRYTVVVCESSALTDNVLPEVNERNCALMSVLLTQLRREAPYMCQRFHEQSFTFTIGASKLVIKHRWDLAHVCKLLTDALSKPTPPKPATTHITKRRTQVGVWQYFLGMLKRFDGWLHDRFRRRTPSGSPLRNSLDEAVIGVPVPEDED